MLIDADALPSGTLIESDICIVGAGPAGLVLAHELSGSGLDVVILESGPVKSPSGRLGEEQVPLTEASSFGPPPHIPSTFGGAANEWLVRLPWMKTGCRMVPLSPIDLEAKSWVPNSGWPLGWDELERYYRRANERLELDGWGYRPEDWSSDGYLPSDLEKQGFRTAMERFVKASVFTEDYVRRYEATSDLRVYLNARVGHLGRSENGVGEIEIDNGHRARLSIRSRIVVLACGGFRNAQLLFNADEGRGLGTTDGVMGRYYMDHLRVASGEIVPPPRAKYKTWGLYDLKAGKLGFRAGKIVPQDDLIRREELLHSAAMILPKVDYDLRTIGWRNGQHTQTYGPNRSSNVRAVLSAAGMALEMAVRQRRLPPRIDAGWSDVRLGREACSQFWVEHQIEQSPEASNRVAPSSRCDRFGRADVELAWKWSELDLRSLETSVDLFGRAVEAAGFGKFEPYPWDEDGPNVTSTNGSFHPMGTTRISGDPKRGVVDVDLRLHGAQNLFVLGSSIFPTGGYANPVFTVIALSIRLADRLKREFSRSTIPES